MRRHILLNGHCGITATCLRKTGETPVQGGLAITPSEMAQMVDNGIPVSSSNAEQFFDGVPNPSWDLPLDARRGIDVATLWQTNRDVKSKVNNLPTVE